MVDSTGQGRARYVWVCIGMYVWVYACGKVSIEFSFPTHLYPDER